MALIIKFTVSRKWKRWVFPAWLTHTTFVKCHQSINPSVNSGLVSEAVFQAVCDVGDSVCWDWTGDRQRDALCHAVCDFGVMRWSALTPSQPIICLSCSPAHFAGWSSKIIPNITAPRSFCSIFYLQLEKNSCFYGNGRTRERGNAMEKKSRVCVCVWGVGAGWHDDNGTQPHCFISVQGRCCCRDCSFLFSIQTEA